MTAWLERASLPFAPGAPPEGVGLAIRAWNLMGGLKFEALDVVADMLGITDIETLIVQLAAIRDTQNAELVGG